MPPWPALRLEGLADTATEEALAPERPLDLRINGETLALTLCSPGSDRELALGQLFGEGLIDSATDVLSWIQGETQGPHPVGPIAFIDATLVTPSKTLSSSPSSSPNSSFSTTGAQATPRQPVAPVQRHGAQNSACGLCGKTAWPEPVKPWPRAFDAIQPTLGLTELDAAFAAMRQTQGDFSRTGGSHAAAAFGFSVAHQIGDARTVGNARTPLTLLAADEDVGRHNAVDKVVGTLLARNLIGKLSGKAPGKGSSKESEPSDNAWPFLLCVSGRIAYEIITKAYRAGFQVLAAVGAPSSLAVAHAQAFGVTLIGFCREGRATVYTCPERMATAAK
jgi:FdhD protein